MDLFVLDKLFIKSIQSLFTDPIKQFVFLTAILFIAETVSPNKKVKK
jgi:hypothetical protein